MRSSPVEIRTPDGAADAYLTRPDEGERHPGLLFVMDAYAVAPANRGDGRPDRRRATPCWRRTSSTGPGRRLSCRSRTWARRAPAPVLRARARAINELTPERVAADGGAYLNELAKVADQPFGITGYCMGARLAWRIAAAHPDRVAALAGFHGGGLVSDDAQSPHLSAGALRAEVYFGHADQDPSNNAEQIATLNAALDDAGVRHRSEIYAGARHGYTMADTPAYDEQACERHFAALFDLFDRTLAR